METIQYKKDSYSENDYRKGDNLLFLLGVPISGKVLILGTELSHWQKNFKNAEFYNSVSIADSLNYKYDLIFLHTSGIGTRKEFIKRLSNLKGLLAEKGNLLLFAKNLFSFLNFKLLIKELRVPDFSTEYGFDSYRRILKKVSFNYISEFLPFQVLNNPEEFVKVKSKFMEQPHYCNSFLKYAKRIGIFHYLHDGYLFLCSDHAPENLVLEKAVSNAIKEYSGCKDARLVIERFDVRTRGATVVFVKDHCSGRYFILRIISDPLKDRIISKNNLFLQYLHTHPKMSGEIKCKIPFQIGKLMHNNYTIYIETLIPGKLAWEANNKLYCCKIRAESIRFILDFNMITRQKIKLDEKMLDKLFIDDENRIECSLCCSSSLKQIISDEITRIKSAILGQEIWTVSTHGDYGYGNILVDHVTKKLEGVIDWDTAKKKDFPGIDLINMEMQRRRIERKMSISEAFNDILSCHSNYIKKYNEIFNINQRLFVILVHIAIIRDITRSLQYPELFLNGQNDQEQAIITINQNFPILPQ